MSTLQSYQQYLSENVMLRSDKGFFEKNDLSKDTAGVFIPSLVSAGCVWRVFS